MITPTIERARYDNRPWTAEFIEQIWRRYGIEGDRHRVATAVVGGMFDVIGDWLLHRDNDPVGSGETQSLIDDLTDFYTAVRRGLATIAIASFLGPPTRNGGAIVSALFVARVALARRAVGRGAGPCGWCAIHRTDPLMGKGFAVNDSR